MKTFAQWIFAAALALSSLAAPAQARQVAQPIGGSGVAQQTLECPKGQFLRGVRGRAGAWIDSIQILCGSAYSFREYDTPGPQRAMVGGGGGGPVPDAVCPPTKALQSVTFGLNAGREVEVFELTCTNYTPKVYLGPTGFSQDGSVHSFSCANSNEALTGIIVNYGQFVNAIGFICDAVPYMSRGFSSAPAPAPSSGGGVALRATVAGMWSLMSETTGMYRVQIITTGQGIAINGADIDQIQVNGILTSQRDPQFSGSFAGLMQANRQMIVNYNLKNGAYGTCLYTYTPDARRLIGQCVDQLKRSFDWSGGRAQ